MHSTCRVQRASGQPVKGEDGELHPQYTTIYEGRCRLRTVSSVTSDIEAADQLLVGQASVLSFPVELSAGIRVNDVATLLASDDPDDDLDPGLIGRRARIAGLHFDTDATARRLPVEMTS